MQKFNATYYHITLVMLMQCIASTNLIGQGNYHYGAIVRGDSNEKNISLIFTGHEFAEGGEDILNTLHQFDAKASFFLTGDFYRNPDFETLLIRMKKEGHYLGAHSDKHLLYCTWEDRDKLLVSKEEFLNDLKANYNEMNRFGISFEDAPYFLPPYEWYNDSISHWSKSLGLQLINFSSGTRSHADYTDPSMGNYVSSRAIFKSIQEYEANSSTGLNGFLLLMHVGVGEKRKDKFYEMLPELLHWLENNGYSVVPLKDLLGVGE
jgi:peptidoglycan/xylan/chitin deacetylase (PgdA/CDA1 family)